MSIRQRLLYGPDTSTRSQVAEQQLEPLPFDPSAVLAEHARTSFNLATRFLPDRQRKATQTLYAFFRMLDDTVDDVAEEKSRDDVRHQITHWHRWATDENHCAPSVRLADAVNAAIDEFNVPRFLFTDFLNGLMSDLDRQEIRTRSDLDQYCYQVASTVGIVMCHVLGARQPEALRAASDLGAAMQMTNILRDVGEDLSIGRVYLPTETLDGYDLNVSLLEELRGDPERAGRVLEPMMRAEIARTRKIYQSALPGIWLLPRESRLSILLAARLYRHLLSVIEANGYDSINFRAATSKWDKLRESAICAILTRLWASDDGTGRDAF